MRKIIISLMVVLMLSVTGCTNMATNPPTGSVEPTADGNTTISQERLLFEATDYPGGSMSQEKYDSKIVTYYITSEGKVTKEYTDGTKDRIRLKDEDVSTIYTLWDDFNTNNVEITEGLICDYPSYELIVYDKDGNKTTFESDANSQCEAVEEVFRIIWSYDEE